jgi:tetratricopeptide (TPR) repeat protein
MRRDYCIQGGVFLLAAAIAAAASAADMKTAADTNRALRQWMTRKFVTDFEAHGRADAAWAPAYREFLPVWAELFDPAPRTLTAEQVAARSDELVAAGCDDPVFVLFRGRVEMTRDRPQEALAAFRRLADVQKAGYPAFYAHYALDWSRQAKAALNPAAGAVPSPDVPKQQILLAVARDPDFADDHQWIYMLLNPGDKPFVAAAAEQFAKADSGVGPWITAMFVGMDHVNRAWDARGAGVAGEVTPEGWKGFAEHLALAREQFTRAHEMHPEWPNAASEMIQVSLGEGRDEERLWFDRAVEARFDHVTSYHRMVRMVLLPRWGGSHEAMVEFGRECLATGRYDTVVPSVAYDAVVAIGEEVPHPRDAVAVPGAYDLAVAACRGYLEAYSEPHLVQLWHSRLAILHWAAGRYAEACRALDAVRDDLATQAVGEWRVRADDVVGESRLFGGPHADAFAAAEGLVEGGAVDEALTAYKPLAKRDDLPAAARKIVAGRLATLETAAAIARYDWVDLQPPADLAGWRVVTGDWRVEPDGTLVGTSGDRGRLKILCEAEIGQDIELTGEVEFLRQPKGRAPSTRIVILLAHAAGEDRQHHAVCVRVDGTGRTVEVTHGVIGGDAPVRRAATKDKKNALRIVLWDGKLTVFVNGEKAVDAQPIPEEWLLGGGLGIAEYAGKTGPPTQVRLRKLRVRKLDQAPDDL